MLSVASTCRAEEVIEEPEEEEEEEEEGVEDIVSLHKYVNLHY